MTIRLLPSYLINQIAAGEVVERPASVLKELIENSLDAGATNIDVVAYNGGKTFLSVSDNGSGIVKDDFPLLFQRHATSKLEKEDLFHIHSFGFRGEALASIASVAKVRVCSCAKGMTGAWEQEIAAGQAGPLKPCAKKAGTLIEVKDLFFAVPARLKFLKSDHTELLALKEVMRHVALSYPSVKLTLRDENKELMCFFPQTQLSDRIADVLGPEVKDNLCAVKASEGNLTLTGFISLPTFHRATASDQYFFVNNRFIKDKMLFGVLKAAYAGLMASDRFPVFILFLTVPAENVDVNVHPAKTQVRFDNLASIKNFMMMALHRTLLGKSHLSCTLSPQTMAHFCHPEQTKHISSIPRPSVQHDFKMPSSYSLKPSYSFAEPVTQQHAPEQPQSVVPALPETNESQTFPPLGLAKAQIHQTYIISQTPDALIITDQHAADERLTYEKIMTHFNDHPQTQMLLVPLVIDFNEHQATALSLLEPPLRALGFDIDVFCPRTWIIKAVPVLLQGLDLQTLILDLADKALDGEENALSLRDKIKDICALHACHTSVRAGRVLNIDEMNALLRQMEQCPTCAQCIHGRPTYIKLTFDDLEKLFKRQE